VSGWFSCANGVSIAHGVNPVVLSLIGRYRVVPLYRWLARIRIGVAQRAVELLVRSEIQEEKNDQIRHHR
jgi:hypothetical protein